MGVKWGLSPFLRNRVRCAASSVRNGGEDERLRAGAGGERDKQAGGS